MKQLLIIIFAITFSACNDSKTVSENKENSAGASVEFPYKMQYADWSFGDANNTKLVLDMYKAWEDNRMEDAAKAFGDSTTYDFHDGTRATTVKASALDTFRVWRSANSKMSYDIITAIPLRSKDKNEDWVSVWANAKWTAKDGKTDSAMHNGNWHIENGRIVAVIFLEKKPTKSN